MSQLGSIVWLRRWAAAKTEDCEAQPCLWGRVWCDILSSCRIGTCSDEIGGVWWRSQVWWDYSVEQRGLASFSSAHPYPLKNGILRGGVVLKFHFKIPLLQSCFLNDQYSSSFHVIGKQVKIKYLCLAPPSTCQTEVAHVYGWHPSKICAAVIILALSSSGAKGKYFRTSAQGLLRNVTLQFHLRGWITIPGFPSKKSGIRQVGFVPPALPLYSGRDQCPILGPSCIQCRQGICEDPQCQG